jgi:hypothetical protein
MRTVLLALCGLGGVSAAPVPKELRKVEDKVFLVGKWESVGGREVAKYEPEHTVTFTADGIATFKYPVGEDQPNDFALDLAASPRLMTFTRSAQVIGQPRPYEFRAGRLVMAMSMGEQKPIRSLEPGPNVIVIEYKRAGTK